MGGMEPPATRSLQLLSLLQTGREWSVPDLSARMEVSERTVRRDAQRLRSLGYDLRSRPGPGAGYRLHPSFKIPPLLFDKDEISAVIAGLLVLEAWAPTDESISATRFKLEQLLPHSLRQRAVATAMATTVLQEAPAPVEWAVVGVLTDAVARSSRVQFSYTDQRGNKSHRTVEPYRHLLRRRRWYLVAFDIDRDEWRLFCLDRMRDISALPGTHQIHDFPSRSIEEWLTTDFGRTHSVAAKARQRADDGLPE